MTPHRLLCVCNVNPAKVAGGVLTVVLMRPAKETFLRTCIEMHTDTAQCARVYMRRSHVPTCKRAQGTSVLGGPPETGMSLVDDM